MEEEKKIRIHYLLSKEGQKKSILSGGNGRQLQVIEVPFDRELFEKCSIDTDGEIILKVGIDQTVDYRLVRLPDTMRLEAITTKYFDAPQNKESLIHFLDTRETYLEQMEKEIKENYKRTNVRELLVIPVSVLVGYVAKNLLEIVLPIGWAWGLGVITTIILGYYWFKKLERNNKDT